MRWKCGDFNEMLPSSRHLNTCSLVGGYGRRLRSCGLTEEIHHWGWALRCSEPCATWSSLFLLPVAIADTSPQLSASGSGCHACLMPHFPVVMVKDSSRWNRKPQENPSFYKLLLSWCFVTATEKQPLYSVWTNSPWPQLSESDTCELSQAQ